MRLVWDLEVDGVGRILWLRVTLGMLFGSVPSLVSLFRLTVVICCQRKLYPDIGVGVALDVAVRGAKKIRKPFWNASEFSLSTYFNVIMCKYFFLSWDFFAVFNKKKNCSTILSNK